MIENKNLVGFDEWIAGVRQEYDLSEVRWPIDPHTDPHAYGSMYVDGRTAKEVGDMAVAIVSRLAG